MSVRLSSVLIPAVLLVCLWLARGGTPTDGAPTQRELVARTYSSASFGREPVADSGFPSRLASGDFNADGRADLVLGAPTDGSDAESGGWVGASTGNARFPGTTFAQGGTERGGEWGASLAVGDFDADGYDDLVIGAPGRDFGAPDSGVLYLWSGSAGGVGGQSRPFGPSLGAGARAGTALAVGDYNGDGVDDLAVGAPGAAAGGESGAGKVVLLPGRAGAGPIATGGLTLERGAVGMPGAPAPRELLGEALAAADVNGDGRAELVIGVPHGSDGTLAEAGVVLVVAFATYPVTGGLRTDRIDELGRSDDVLPGDAARSAGFGAALTTGDFDGDGRSDIVIAAPGAGVDGQTGAGDVVVLYGATSFPQGSRTLLLSESTPGMPGSASSRAAFGSSLATGDLDGDGRDDLAVGAPQTRVGSYTGVGLVTVVLSGEAGLDPTTGSSIAPGLGSTGFAPAIRQAFGSSLLVSDLNGDGVSDLAIGATGMAAGGVEQAGSLVVVWGEHDVLPGVATATHRPVTPTQPPALTSTPGATATTVARPGIALPYVTRLRSLDLWSTPVP